MRLWQGETMGQYHNQKYKRNRDSKTYADMLAARTGVDQKTRISQYYFTWTTKYRLRLRSLSFSISHFSVNQVWLVAVKNVSREVIKHKIQHKNQKLIECLPRKTNQWAIPNTHKRSSVDFVIWKLNAWNQLGFRNSFHRRVKHPKSIKRRKFENLDRHFPTKPQNSTKYVEEIAPRRKWKMEKGINPKMAKRKRSHKKFRIYEKWKETKMSIRTW